MFGAAPPPQTETTPFHPRSPYAVAKVSAYWATVNYREAYGLFAVNGILFNHESPRRGETFVTRKITRAVGAHQGRPAGQALPRQPRRQAGLGLRAGLRRGDVADAAGTTTPDDYVVATGETHSVREFLEAAFGHAGLDWERYVEIDPALLPPRRGRRAAGRRRPRRARSSAGRPKVGFDELVQMMVDADISSLEDQLAGKVVRYSHEA